MLKVAIAGNIASGKSAVENILKMKGFSIADTDEFAHDLLEDNSSVLNAFAGYDILDKGKISRKKLGKVVFYDKNLKTMLENILHPQIRDKINEFFNLHSVEDIVFVSIPLLFEAGMDDLFDKILFIYADDEIRLLRLIKRNNYTIEYAKTRMNAQLSQEEKVQKADWVIYNNSSLDDLEAQIITLVEQIR